jgi:hypothetical protein
MSILKKHTCQKLALVTFMVLSCEYTQLTHAAGDPSAYSRQHLQGAHDYLLGGPLSMRPLVRMVTDYAVLSPEELSMALFDAVEANNVVEVQRLLAVGARAGLNLEVQDYSHQTVLEKAVRKGNPAMVRVLVTAGADIYHAEFRWGDDWVPCSLLDVVGRILENEQHKFDTLTMAENTAMTESYEQKLREKINRYWEVASILEAAAAE